MSASEALHYIIYMFIGSLIGYAIGDLIRWAVRRRKAIAEREAHYRIDYEINEFNRLAERRKRIFETRTMIKELQEGAQIICKECGRISKFVGQELPFVCPECGEVIVPEDWLRRIYDDKN